MVSIWGLTRCGLQNKEYLGQFPSLLYFSKLFLCLLQIGQSLFEFGTKDFRPPDCAWAPGLTLCGTYAAPWNLALTMASNASPLARSPRPLSFRTASHT